LIAADPAGFALWTASDLKGMEKKLSEKVDNARFASKQLEKFGNHYTMLAHREGDGSAELHEKDADIFFVESGTATLLVGGEMVGAKTTAPGEVRGTSVKNGVEHKLGPGDIVHIAAKTPHQMLLDGGKGFTYFVIKVAE
jgi:mannose-6-phosphate isomerase-like protein (cupin superfamily)